MHVVATAGHVDHGKSTLVRALTGMEPDRWAEERRRGMTIDLGYAWTTLPSGRRLAFVDVPGHQRFIANMLAGIGPVPAVLFVVAADGGWSRQSAEHLAAAHALGVRHAVLAVTRADLADPADALSEARRQLAATSLGAVPAVTVSGRTGAGLDDVRAALDAMLAALPEPAVDAPVRLWVDRSFAVRGAGTVVTGTLPAGRIAVGDTLRLRGRDLTVRGLQALGESCERVDALTRVAVNLRGAHVDDVGRGDVLLTPGEWHDAAELDVSVDADTLPSRLVLHAGTAAVPVRVRRLGPGAVRLRLDRPLPLRRGDRAVLRDPGRQVLAAGAVVLDADPPELRRRGDAARRADALRAGPPPFGAEVARRGAVRLAELGRLGLTAEPGAGVRTVAGWAVSADAWQAWVDAVGPARDAWSAAHPLQPDVPLAALARAVGLPDGALLAPLLAAAGVPASGGAVPAPRPATSLGPAEAGVRELEVRLGADPFAAPTADELAELGLGRRELAAAARVERLLVIEGPVGPVVLLPSAADAAHAVLAGLVGPFTLSEARAALGTTRRVAVPLLEHLDRLDRTERLDAARRRLR